MNNATAARPPLTDAELAELPPAEAAAVRSMREAFRPVAGVAAAARRAGYRSEGRLVRRCGDELDTSPGGRYRAARR